MKEQCDYYMYPKVLMEIQGTADPDLQKRLSAPVTQRVRNCLWRTWIGDVLQTVHFEQTWKGSGSRCLNLAGLKHHYNHVS